MPPKTATNSQPHIGRKIQRIRTIKGIQQKNFAKLLGIHSSTLSNIENSENVDEQRLQQIADALEMSVETIKNFNEEAVINYIQHINEGAVGNQGNDMTNHFNPVEKLVEVFEDNKKLYERLLDSEHKRNEQLESQLLKTVATK